MDQSLIPLSGNAVAVLDLSKLADSAQRYVGKAKAPRTVKAYDSDWRDFREFCQARGFASLPAPPETVALYLAWMADEGRKPATLSRRLAAISKMHAAAGFPDSPAAMRHASVKEVWSGIRRTKGTAQNQKAAATTDYLKQMLAQVPDTLTGLRDRSLLLLGFAGALRRGELVALTVQDVRFVPDGLELTIRKSKTDQDGAGEKIGIQSGRLVETCPVRSLQAWFAAAAISSGPIFRSVNRWGVLGSGRGVIGSALSDRVVALRVKKYAEAAGLEASLFSGHSLRAGLATSAANAGASERRIMDQTRHKSVSMVRRYIREGNLFRDNVSAIVGL